ncbi:phasin family protein [Mesorhizobium sp. NPDC059054]|uniref:phasin family protein n=1 Tax=Mesorhizobium sp. NPDC059054 TaxID=3346711 RepID=UPI0036ABA0CF
MAKQSEPESFMDMFSKLGRDLRMPQVDIDAILSHHRKNLEALEKSARATATGASSVMTKQREVLQDSLREITELVQNYRAPGNPQELVAKQADFTRKSFEAAVKNAGEVADIVKKSGTESVDILRARIKDAMDEIRQSYEKK